MSAKRPSLVAAPFRFLILVILLSVAMFAVRAQNVPALTGRVVDQADLLPPDQEAAITAKLETLERATARQLVVVTVPDLQGYSVEDFGFRLGEAWKLGDEQADNGAILLVAVADRKIRIEVGDGLEPILTDAMSSIIIRRAITPRFRDGDFVGGINAGVDAILEQLQAPPELAEQRAIEAAASERQREGDEGGSLLPLIVWVFILLFILLPLLAGGFAGRRYRGRRRGAGPVTIWGPGTVSGRRRHDGEDLGWFLAGMILGGMRGGGGGGGGGGWSGGGGGEGFGGFSGGGGSFGGGGASGGW